MVFTRVGAEAFHWERRIRVLARDILRLGTAMTISSLFLLRVGCVNTGVFGSN